MNDAVSSSPGDRLDRALAELSGKHVGPGGAVAVLRQGEVLARHCWGWADAERRIPFTTATMALICSITKQFTCSLLLDQFPDPSVLDADVRAMLPALQQEPPRARDLCNNQSGLRDYWASAMLCGAPAESVFGPEDAARLIGSARTLQFEPGTRYSYANQNFRILSAIIERRTGKPFAELLRSRVFDRAGMPDAVVNADTSAVQGGTIGYEGSLGSGFRPAENHIHWTGDAGIAASLEDMIAWERFIDATREDVGGLYARISAPQSFRDGTPAAYGFGLGRARLLGRAATSHSGGLRGWRSFRCNLPAERVSAVVLFNHMADPRAAALELLAALFDDPAPPPAPGASPDGWTGRYEEPETGLAVRIEAGPDHRLRLQYGQAPEQLDATADGAWASATARLVRAGEALVMERPLEHQATRLMPCPGTAPAAIEAAFHNAELDSDLTLTRLGGVPYGAFSGRLGRGMMQPLLPFGPDLWLLPCPRALDYSPPGDWTLKFQRNESGRITGVQVGCWLARRIDYRAA